MRYAGYVLALLGVLLVACSGSSTIGLVEYCFWTVLAGPPVLVSLWIERPKKNERAYRFGTRFYLVASAVGALMLILMLPGGAADKFIRFWFLFALCMGATMTMLKLLCRLL